MAAPVSKKFLSQHRLCNLTSRSCQTFGQRPGAEKQKRSSLYCDDQFLWDANLRINESSTKHNPIKKIKQAPRLQQVERFNGRFVQARHPGAVTVARVGPVHVVLGGLLFQKLAIWFWHPALGQQNVKEVVKHLAGKAPTLT